MLCVSENKSDDEMNISSESRIATVRENKQEWSNILDLLAAMSNEVAMDQYRFDVKSKSLCEETGRE